MPTKFKYRIQERFMSDGKKEYMPQRCEVNSQRSLFSKLFLIDTRPREHWSSIANFQNQEYDRGYSTMERAQMDIDNDKAKRLPEVLAVRTYSEEEIYPILHPND